MASYVLQVIHGKPMSAKNYLIIFGAILFGMIIIGAGICYIKQRQRKLGYDSNPQILHSMKEDVASKVPQTTMNDDSEDRHIMKPMLPERCQSQSSQNEDNSHWSSSINKEEAEQPENSRIGASLKVQLQKILETSKREVDRERFDVGDQIGSGNFGKVYKGTIKGLFNDGSKTTVAIKTISDEVNETELENIICEIKIMSSVNPHMNLVSMVASCSTEFNIHGKLWLLLEFCVHGDLKMFLIENRAKLRFGNDEDVLNNRCLILWAYDVANGMEYLARKEIMHGDLAARNILMDENPLKGGYPVAKIADFGLSKKFNDSLIYEKESRLFVPWRWMALEYLTDSYFTLKSDVWSFGVLFWEILSLGKVPYGHQSYDEVLENLKKGTRLPFPDDLEYINVQSPAGIYKKISDKCFVANPNDRSSFSEVVKMIEAELCKNELLRYKSMNDMYLSTRTENYLKLERR